MKEIVREKVYQEAVERPGDEALLYDTWKPDPGLWGWLRETHHAALGKRFIVTAFVFFALGGLEALLIRLQLARPENRLMSPDLYGQVFTVHGTTMMFLFAVPVMEGMSMYLVPLMIGARNMAFPRLNAYGYWCYVIGGVLLYVGLFLNIGPDAGWFAYTPLSGPDYTPGKRVDIWAQMITFTEISALAGAVNVIVTVFKNKAPGMSLARLPLFVWASLVTSFMIVFAMPAVMLASGCLALDRLVGTHFFNPVEGGDPLLWQHLFWFFGHPEVYIIFIPASGMVSSIVIAFSRRHVVAYIPMVLALVSTAFIGFGLWVHHMFATGLPQQGETYFTAASMMVAIPTGIQIFAWLGTLWTGRPQWRVPLYYAAGFIATFVLGGLSGVMLASVPIDLQVHDTFFVVAHLHYVLIGGAIFPLLGGIAFWFPKMTGRMLSEAAGKVAFWVVFFGFNLTFFPMHHLGLRGMPRRVYTYSPEMGWTDLNVLATVGAFVLGVGVLVYVANALWAMARGQVASADPWLADGLEWSIPSPPPPYNFKYIPTVRGRYPMWTSAPDQPVVTGLRLDAREVLVTDVLDARPDHKTVNEGSSIWPLFLALGTGVTFIGSIFTPWGLVAGAVPSAIALIGWFWPKPPIREPILEEKPA